MQLANIKEKAGMLVVISSFVMPDGFFFRNGCMGDSIIKKKKWMVGLPKNLSKNVYTLIKIKFFGLVHGCQKVSFDTTLQ